MIAIIGEVVVVEIATAETKEAREDTVIDVLVVANVFSNVVVEIVVDVAVTVNAVAVVPIGVVIAILTAVVVDVLRSRRCDGDIYNVAMQMLKLFW